MKNKGFLPTIFLTIFVDLIGVGVIIPVLAVLFLDDTGGIFGHEVDFATRTIMIGVLAAIYPIMQFFGAPILGALSDRHGRKPVLIIALIGTAIGYVLFAIGIVIGSIPLLLFSRALDGFTGGNISIINSAIADVSEGDAKVRNFGLIGMAFGLGFIMGPFIGGVLSDPDVVSWFSFATPFWFSAALATLNIVFVIKAFPETSKSRIKTPISVTTGFINTVKAFTLPNLRTLFIVAFFTTFGFTFYVNFFQVFLVERFSFDTGDIGLLFAYMGLWIAFVQGVLIRPISRRFEPHQVIRTSPLIVVIALPMLLLPSSAWMLYLIMPFLAIGNGLIRPNYTALISSSADASSQGEVLGISQSVQALAMAIPPLIGGVIVAFHISAPILAASFFIAIAWIVFVAWYRTDDSSKFHEI